jgi:hypothetical protein
MSDHSDHTTDRCVFTVFSLCSRCVLTTFAPYSECVLTVFSLCSHGVLTVFSPCSQLCSQLCSHCVIPVLSPCLLRGFEMNSHRARTMLCLPLPRSISLSINLHITSLACCRRLTRPAVFGRRPWGQRACLCSVLRHRPKTSLSRSPAQEWPLHSTPSAMTLSAANFDSTFAASLAELPLNLARGEQGLAAVLPRRHPLKDTSLQERRCAGLPAEPRKLNLC